MRRFAVVAVLLLLVVGELSMFAQPFRIVTWQVARLSAVQTGDTNSAADERRFAEIASTLGETDADVIILYGISESEALKKVTGLIKQRKYSVAHHMVFRQAGSKSPVIGQAVAILSRRERMAAKTMEWNNTGRIDMPGGFGFAVFRFGPHAVSVYVAGLPGSLTNGVGTADGHYFSRKRNYAAQFMAHHATWVAGTYTNPVHATYLTGDFLLNSKGPVVDEGGKLLDAAGFRTSVPGVAVDKTTVSITNALELDRVQDPIFTRGVEFLASRQLNRAAPEFPLMVCDLTLKSGPTAAKATVPARLRPPGVKPVPFSDPELPAPLPIPAPEPAGAKALPALALAGSSSPGTAVQKAPQGTPASAMKTSNPPLTGSARNPMQAAVTRFPWNREQRWAWWLAAGTFAVG